MKLAPRIIQAMEILQLPMHALLERIDVEMQANPVLEMREGGDEEPIDASELDEGAQRGEEVMVVEDSDGNSEDFERLADFTDEYGMESFTSDAPYSPPARASGERDQAALPRIKVKIIGDGAGKATRWTRKFRRQGR